MDTTSSSRTILYDPVFLVTLEYSISAVVLGFTRKGSLIRIGLVPLLAFIVQLELRHALEYTVMLRAAFWATGALALFLHYLDIALFQPLSIDTDPLPPWSLAGPAVNASIASKTTHTNGSTKPSNRAPRSTIPAWQKLYWGAHVMCNFTHIGLRSEVRGIPPFYRAAPSKIPSRSTLILWRGLSALLIGLFYDLLIHFPRNYSPIDIKTEFSTARIPLLTAAENWTPLRLGLRAAATLGFAFVITLGVHFVYNAAAFLSLAVGASPPVAWPPVYGSIKDAWSLRGLWGHFWHQTFRRMFGGVAKFVTQDVLRLPRGSYVRRVLEVTLVFATSGFLHHWCAVSGGFPSHKDGGVRFFLMQAFGVVVEDLVRRAYVRVLGRKGEASAWEKALGYAWVACFEVWVTPGWIYPFATHEPMPTSFLPISLFDKIF